MFLVCGEALFDMFVDPTDDGSAEVSLRGMAGGSPYNVAVGLARLKQAVTLATDLSSDLLGRRLEAALRNEGVDLSFVHRAERPTPLALIDVGRGGLPGYAFHGLAERRLYPNGPVLDDDRLVGIHVGSIALVSDETCQHLLPLVSRAGRHLISFDPNVRLAFEPDVALWAARVDEFRRHANLIKVSLEDLAALYGSGCAAEEIVRNWLGGATKVVALTRGEEGCTFFSAQGWQVRVQAPPVIVADTVGAGDTFQAALLCWLNEEGLAGPDGLASIDADQLRGMGEFAAEAAALTCRRRGPNMPRREELPPAR
jgi:fructokinase